MLFALAYQLVDTGRAAVQANPMDVIGWSQILVGGAVGGAAWYLVSNGYIEMRIKLTGK